MLVLLFFFYKSICVVWLIFVQSSLRFFLRYHPISVYNPLWNLLIDENPINRISWQTLQSAIISIQVRHEMHKSIRTFFLRFKHPKKNFNLSICPSRCRVRPRHVNSACLCCHKFVYGIPQQKIVLFSTLLYYPLSNPDGRLDSC